MAEHRNLGKFENLEGQVILKAKIFFLFLQKSVGPPTSPFPTDLNYPRYVLHSLFSIGELVRLLLMDFVYFWTKDLKKSYILSFVCTI